MANGEFSSLGIHSDIAEEKQEYWSSFAPLALEAVLSIGQKARDGTLSGDIPFKSYIFSSRFDLLHYETVDTKLLCYT